MMKKIFALLVVLSMVFCFAACGPEETPTPENPTCTDHVDADGNGICDTPGCGASVKGEYAPTPVAPGMAAAYVNAIWGAVEAAKTVTATVDVTNAQTQTAMTDAEGNVIAEAFSAEMSVHFDLTLAMAENGINLKVTGNASMKEGEDTENQNMEAYIVDGIAYARTMYGEEWGEWSVSPIELPEEAAGMISQFTALVAELIPEGFEITPEMIGEIKAAFASAITALMTVNEDGSFGAKVDAKVVIDEVIEFITSIKAEDTIGSVVNKILAIADPEMTIEAILDGVGTYGAITVGEIYTAVNDALVTETGMGINAIKNAILAEDAIVAILVDSGMVDAETLARVKEADLDVMVQEYAAMTIDDVVYMIMMAQSAPDEEVQPASDTDAPAGDETVDTAGTLAAMMEQVKGMLATTVGELMAGQYDMVMDVIESIGVKDCYSYITIKIGSDLSIEKIEIGTKMDITVTAPSVEYVKVELEDGYIDYVPVEGIVTSTMFQEITFTITSVSNATTTITAPQVEAA